MTNFLKNLEIGDRVVIVESEEVYDPKFENEFYGFPIEKFIGQTGKVVSVDPKWDFPIEIEFDSPEINDLRLKLSHDLWLESQVEWY